MTDPSLFPWPAPTRPTLPRPHRRLLRALRRRRRPLPPPRCRSIDTHRDFLLRHWHALLLLGTAHGVNPVLFGALYLAHHPLFWGTMAWLAARVRRQAPGRPAVAALGVFFWMMPYAYVFLFGRGLPWWAYGLALFFLAVGGTTPAKKSGGACRSV